LNIGSKKPSVPHIPVKEAKISYENREEELIIKSPSEKGVITVVLEEKIPTNKTITIDLGYELSFNSEREEWKKMVSYPFSTFFHEFNTANIIPEKAYLLSEENKIENIKDVGMYTVEIVLPEGFTHKGKPSELKYFEIIKREAITREDNSTFGIVHPSFSCLDIESIPMNCLKAKPVLTPNEGSTYKKITWASPIINGQPKKLSFDVTENLLYRALWILLLFVSVAVVGMVFRYRKWYIESIFGCVGLFLALRLSLPIPPFVTLFEIIIFITIMAILILSHRNKEKVKRYFCTKCKKHHNIGKRLYNKHLKYKIAHS